MSSVWDICVVFKVGFDIMRADETLSGCAGISKAMRTLYTALASECMMYERNHSSVSNRHHADRHRTAS
jgi:hypothetical protein